MPGVVRIEKSDELAAGYVPSGIARFARAAVLAERDYARSLGRTRRKLAQYGRRVVAIAVVHQDDLQRRRRLRQHGHHGPADGAGAAPTRDYHAHARLLSHA